MVEHHALASSFGDVCSAYLHDFFDNNYSCLSCIMRTLFFKIKNRQKLV